MKVHLLEKILFGILALGLIGGMVFIWTDYDQLKKNPITPTSPTPTLIDGATKNAEDTLEVDLPKKGQTINSPLNFSGRAKAWYFEGSFPVKLYDQDGTLLGQALATAQGDWMTANFVEFKGSMVFKKPKGASGILKFSKDNPSGDPKNDEDFVIPVIFNQTTAAQPEGSCSPDLAKCKGNPELCMKENANKACS